MASPPEVPPLKASVNETLETQIPLLPCDSTELFEALLTKVTALEYISTESLPTIPPVGSSSKVFGPVEPPKTAPSVESSRKIFGPALPPKTSPSAKSSSRKTSGPVEPPKTTAPFETTDKMIKAIFYTEFHPTEGNKVLYQVPEGAVVPTAASVTQSLFEFEAISTYVIPPADFCNRLLAICANKYRIIGHPVRIDGSKYDRNAFMFNFAIVLEEDADFSSYNSVVRKLAKLFKALEEHSEFLSKEVTRQKVYALIEQVMEDLNNYSECMIPIGNIPRDRFSRCPLMSFLVQMARTLSTLSFSRLTLPHLLSRHTTSRSRLYNSNL
jgi:Nitrogen permease regulator 2